jgi:copper chaperone NosL
MVDFYRWEYQYGHNLDPTAPIQVPGMAYQPPLIGYKQLLNFSAYSAPDKGGWAMIGAGVLLATAFTIEFMRNRKEKRNNRLAMNVAGPAIITAMMLILPACTTGPEAIRFGKDGCDHCRMTIMDKKFGGEVITSKGKVYRFDDIRCMADFLNAGSADKTTSTVYFLDYDGSGQLVKSDSAFLMKSDALRSPMGGNTAAFREDSRRQETIKQLNGSGVKWEDFLK